MGYGVDSVSEVVDRLEQITSQNSLTAFDGSIIKLPAHYDYITACVHSESPNSLEILEAAKAYLDKLNSET